MSTLFRDKVTAGDISFNDPGALPVGAMEWGIDDISGWKSLPSLDVVSTPVGGGADGEFLSDKWPVRARHMLVSGYATASTRAAAELLQDVIARDAFPRNKDVVLTRHEGIPKYMVCRVADREFQDFSQYEFRWVVTLIAGNPFKYDADPPDNSSGSAGVAGTSSGGRVYPRTYPLTYTTNTESEFANQVVVTNRGTANTWPVMTLTGPLVKGAWRLTNDTTARDVRFDVGLAVGDTMTINFQAREALLNGTLVTPSILGDFWPVVPGVNVIKMFADYDPSAAITASIESAWE